MNYSFLMNVVTVPVKCSKWHCVTNVNRIFILTGVQYKIG